MHPQGGFVGAGTAREVMRILQGYLAHKEATPHRPLHQANVAPHVRWSYGKGAAPYERVTPHPPRS